MEGDAASFLTALQSATNDHDLDALVDCFTEDYRNDTPAHPTRSFTGRTQVRSNWQQIFGFLPDLHSRILGSVVDGDTVWSEWEMSGTRRDGSSHLMRGVIVFGVVRGRAARARFYLEPVDETNIDVSAAVRAQVQANTQP